MAQVQHPDGRIELADATSIHGSRFYNAELAPVPIERRTWTTYNYFALWMGMAHNIPSYLLASGLIAIGMNWAQAFLTITVGNLIVLVPMLLNSHAGTKYGIPFPVFARAFYGIRGANLAALLRGLIACGWFGIQTWVGGSAIFVILGRLIGDSWTGAAEVFGQPWTMWLGFLLFWAFQMVIIWRGMDAVRRFENWTAPLVTVGFLILLAWVLVKAGGLGPIFSQPSQLGWGADFWKVFAPSLMGMIAFWATLSLNMPDFTRFGSSQRKQAWGQVLGLPTTMSFMAIVSIMVTSGGIVIYGEAIWDPVELASRFDSPVVVVLSLLMLGLATVSANLAANVVSPSYDFSNAFPKRISFRVGGLITGVIGIAIQPWRLISDPNIYIFAWLNFYGGVLAAVAGVLVAGYWVHTRTRLELAELFTERGRYWFRGGWNWRALVASAVGAVLAVGGAYSEPGAGPFPADGLIPVLRIFYDYSWVAGLAAAFVVYLLLSAGRSGSVPTTEHSNKEGTSDRPRESRTDPAAVDG
ncbi:NCS1 family nucleobase:cation symporter-1 [Amycolatopsis cihanbeyliensis]|uniref:NCS1 family nucleobase:cation symporter-1 n=1 Tax=Amycolatopsis cihanbeyliensis TaxID=1128664 RepID=A0A542CTI8_AMYCI|nr:NCS1 family nucleobase:cation symporter-1 [Amycolatopsis cihanbeyliensis]TQI94146.1 NCS1 family nucleobase:cation symporter-1 [Amycolatopsis cihanbeyliensis]